MSDPSSEDERSESGGHFRTLPADAAILPSAAPYRSGDLDGRESRPIGSAVTVFREPGVGAGEGMFNQRVMTLAIGRLSEERWTGVSQVEGSRGMRSWGGAREPALAPCRGTAGRG